MAEENETALAWWVATCMFLAGGAAVILIANQATDHADVSLQIATALLGVYAASRLAWIIGKGEVRPISCSFWMFVFTAMACAPLAQATLGLYPRLADPSQMMPALILTATGCFAWDVGYRFSPYVTKQGALSATERLRPVDDRRLVIVGILGAFMSMLYIAITGPSRFFESRSDLAAGLSDFGGDEQAISGPLQAFGQVPVFVVFILVTCVLIRDRERRTTLVVGAWILLLCLNVIVNNPVSNARFWFLTVLLGALFSFPLLRPNGFRAVVVLGVVAALLIFPYSDYFRNDSEYRVPLETDSVIETLAVKDFDQVVMTANAFWWVDSRDSYTYGGQTLGALLFFVPRTVWDDKPIDTGVEIGRAMRNDENVNLSSPLWSEFYVDFGWPGMILGFLAVGLLGRRGDELFLQLRNSVRRQVFVMDLLVPVIAAYGFIILRGPLLQAMSRLSVLLLVLWFVRARSRLLSSRERATLSA